MDSHFIDDVNSLARVLKESGFQFINQLLKMKVSTSVENNYEM